MPDFSPLPSPSNNPLQNLKVIAADTTIYIAPGWLGSAGKTGSAGSWTGQTLGNDNTGDGTAGKPFATLKKAWETAQQSVISGNATLTIQFQKGIYDLNGGTTHDNFFPDNLYHPQGSNIIIQGDPVAVKQKYLWRVADYSWDLGKISHWGHTGDVYLWNLSGGTAHGFTGEDEGGYVAISNVSLGSAEYYEDPSQASGATAFRDVRYDTRGEVYGATGSGVSTTWKNWGNHFWSHAYPHEDGDGIIGLAKIRGASGSADALRLVFKNANVDLRPPGFYENTPASHAGGIRPGLSANNSGRWCGVTGSWPESQYSKPNGYYGATASRNVNYPNIPAGLTYVTDEIFTVTNYPVVIRSDIYSSTVKPPLVVRGGKIKAIRNLMFTTSAVDGVSFGAQSISYGLSQLNPDTKYQAPNLLVVDEGGEVGIRHIGAAGWNTAVKAQRFGKVSAYSSVGVESSATTIANQHQAGAIHIKADSAANPLDNTPILMSSLCTNGIVAERNATVDLSLQSYGAAGVYLTDSSVWNQSVLEGIVSTEKSEVIVGSGWSNNVAALPFFRMIVNIPVFGGSTLGTTAGFYNPEVWGLTAGYLSFRDIRLVIGAGAGGSNKNDYIGRVQYAIAGSTFNTNSTQRSGWTGSSWSKSAGFVEAQPLYTQQVTLVGYMLNGQRSTPAANNHGIYGRRDITAWIANAGGYYVAVEGYSDEPGSVSVGGISFDNTSMTVKGSNGSYLVGTTAAGNGLSAALFAFDFVGNADGDNRIYYYGGNACSNTRISNNGSMQIIKQYSVRGGRCGIFLNESGNLSTRSHLSFFTAMENSEAGLSCTNNSRAQIGNVFVKNLHPVWFSADGQINGIYVGKAASVWHSGNYACALSPLTSMGAWGRANSNIQNGRLGYLFNLGQIFGMPSGESSGMLGTTNVALESAANDATRMENIKRQNKGIHSVWVDSGVFDGEPFTISEGRGHRVSIRDGREPNRREQIESTGYNGLAFNTTITIPVVFVTGNGFLSPFTYRTVPTDINSVSSTNVTSDEYSFSHIIDGNIPAGAPLTTGKRIGSRCEWGGAGGLLFNTVMKIPVGATGYQWWSNDNLGVMWNGVGSRPSTSSTGVSHMKLPIMITVDSTTPTPQNNTFPLSNYNGAVNTSVSTMQFSLGQTQHKFSVAMMGLRNDAGYID